MNDSQWDAKLKGFLKKTGEDFKRFGNDVKAEAQKLYSEVKDPERQEELREGLKSIGQWARKAAEDAANLMENGVRKAEGALNKAAVRVNDLVVEPLEQAGGKAAPAKDSAKEPAATPPSPPPAMDDAPAPKPRAKKTVGKAPAKKKAAASKKPAAKKTIGR